MALNVNDGGIWKEPAPRVNDGGVWKEVSEVWVNDNGVWKKSYTALNMNDYAIGDFVGGGYYYYNDGTYAYIVASSTYTNQWGGYGHETPGADSTTDGIQNTLDLINDTESHPSAIWANGSKLGYDDWFMPAVDQLWQLYLNKQHTSLDQSDYHWSSTEADFDVAKAVRFSDGNIGNVNKSLTSYATACCIRRVEL